MMGKTYLSLIQYRRPESGSNLLDADMAKNLLFYSWEPNMSEFRNLYGHLPRGYQLIRLRGIIKYVTVTE